MLDVVDGEGVRGCGSTSSSCRQLGGEPDAIGVIGVGGKRV